MVWLIIDGQKSVQLKANDYDNVVNYVLTNTTLDADDFYLEKSGKLFTKSSSNVYDHEHIRCILRQCGGKGGFGSMLRAIGAQIEKTTNKEACRDLSGRRLRDINEEKHLKAWIENQKRNKDEGESRTKKKYEKLLAKPKHEFSDSTYEETRSKVSEKVSNAVDAGLQMADNAPSTSRQLKRKHTTNTETSSKLKTKKKGLWLEEFSDTDGSDTDDSSPATKTLKETHIERVTTTDQ